jgi:hypothetical protein
MVEVIGGELIGEQKKWRGWLRSRDVLYVIGVVDVDVTPRARQVYHRL